MRSVDRLDERSLIDFMRPFPTFATGRLGCLVTAAAIGCLSLAYSAPAVAVRVLTVEKLGGPAVNVGDRLVAKLESSRKVQFVKEGSEVVCGGSEILGDVTSNPEKKVGGPGAEIEVENLTFSECNVTIGGVAGTVKRIQPERLPLLIKTEGTSLQFTEKGFSDLRLEIVVETAGKVEIGCLFAAEPVTGKYENSNGEIEVAQVLNKFVSSLSNCNAAPNNSLPNWKQNTGPFRTKQVRIKASASSSTEHDVELGRKTSCGQDPSKLERSLLVVGLMRC